MTETSSQDGIRNVDRRRFLGSSLGAFALTPLIPPSYFQLAGDLSRSLTKAERDGMSPSSVIEELKKGNERFRSGKMVQRDYLAEQKSSAKGQYPAAVFWDAWIRESRPRLFSIRVLATRLSPGWPATL